MQYLFVYGSLKRGEENAYVLENIGGDWIPATLQGRLYPEGLATTYGYPALVVDAEGDEVQGYVFSSARLPQHWQQLDDFEGEGYQRRAVQVTLTGGQQLDAYVYEARQPE